MTENGPNKTQTTEVELAIVGLPCSPLSHNLLIHPIKGSVISKICLIPVHRISDDFFTAQHLLVALYLKFVTSDQ